MLLLKSIWNVLIKNPVLLIAIFIGIALVVFILKYQHRGVIIQNYQTQVINFQADTLQRGRDKGQLQQDTAFYLGKLREAQKQIDKAKAYDKKSNPGLVDEFPDISDLKRQRR